MKQTNLYDFYKNYYDLKKLNLKVSNKKIMFLIYDDKYYYYLNKTKFIDSNSNNAFLKIIRLLKQDFKLDIINYYPVCFCDSTLIMALRIENNNHTLLNQVKTEEIPCAYKPLIDYHRQNFEMLYVSSNVKKEIKMSKKYINRYKIHNKIIKKYILTDKKRRKDEFKKLLNDLIPKEKSIIDVSCGDNSDIFEIAKQKKYEVIVGNDICINYLDGHKKDYVIYTNDDIELNMIKKNSYEVVYCKNTLHHMNNLTNIKNMLSFLDKISSNEIIIIEIINPIEYGGLPKFLNKYLYTKFLKDVGSCYLSEKQFKQVIDEEFNNCNIEYSSFENILGKYMIAKIKKETDYEN